MKKVLSISFCMIAFVVFVLWAPDASGTCIPTGVSETVCNWIDDDCDALIDEDYMPMTTTCGIGECISSGQTTCVDGVEGDTCIPGTPAAEVCDNLDNDCDGSVDEDCPPVGCGECTSDADCPSGTICNADVLCLVWCTCPECTVCAGHCVLPPPSAYTMYITSGVAHTSGGFDGQGIGDIPVSGTFNMYVDSNNMVAIEDIAVSDDPSMLNWNDLTGNLTGTALYLMAPSPDPAFFDTEFTGTFNGTSLSMSGTHSDPCYDCYQYDYVIHAVVATDNDRDGYAPEFDDCDDNDPLVNPGVAEDCSNGIDDDCDGLIDGDDPYCTTDCFTNADCLPDFYCDKPAGICGGQGTCQPIPEVCIDVWDPVCGCNGVTYGNSCYAARTGVNVYYTGECTPCGGPPEEELCDNLDNDCDGLIDEDLTRPTTCGVGECVGMGQETCSAGMWGNDTCYPGTPSAEVCDNLDNDCDGSIDENLTRPTTCGVGECAGNTGIEECQNGVIVDTCDPLAGAVPEVCDINFLDEDCDGIANECCNCIEGEQRPCGSDTGECVAGIEICVVSDTYCGWSGICEGEVGPTAEVCDNLDNDCDGATDENLTRPTTCGVGECVGTGQETCSAGMWSNDTCYPGTPSAEVCDNLDNDCDGAIDENLTRPTTCGVGECAGNTGIEECQSGVIVDTCDPLAGAVPEVCDVNNLDEDCDGAVNEGCVDLDITRFRVSNSAKIGSEIKRIQLTVENPNGGGQDMRPATLTGVQNGVEVYNQTRMVFDLSGNGRSRFAFPPFTPAEAGVINWTVEILDDDPDDDTATASTNVK